MGHHAWLEHFSQSPLLHQLNSYRGKARDPTATGNFVSQKIIELQAGLCIWPPAWERSELLGGPRAGELPIFLPHLPSGPPTVDGEVARGKEASLQRLEVLATLSSEALLPGSLP